MLLASVREGRQKSEAAVLLLVALLAAVALLPGCGESQDAGAKAKPAETLPSGQTGAVLEPGDGRQASGTAILLPRTPKRPAHFKVRLDGLKPNTNGGQYIVWLTTSRHDMVPLYSYPVGKSGIFAHEWTPNPLHVEFIETGKKDKFVITLAKNDAE